MLLIVIVLNRWSLTWANKKSNYTKDLPFYLRYKYPLIVLGLVSLGIFALFFPFAYQIPRGLTITTEPFWDAGVFWIAEHWFDGLQSFRVFLSLGVLIPMRDAYLSLPTFAVLVLVVGAGWILGGVRSAMIVLAYLLRTMTNNSLYLSSDWWDNQCSAIQRQPKRFCGYSKSTRNLICEREKQRNKNTQRNQS